MAKVFSDMSLPTRDELNLECGEEFDISVEHTVEVERCGSYNSAEQEKMFNGLMRKWLIDALSQCGTLSECQSPEVVDFLPADDVCAEVEGKKFWTQKAIFNTKCVP